MSKKKRALLILLCAAAALLICAAVVLNLPAVQLGRAFQNTFKAARQNATLSVYADDYGVFDMDLYLDSRELILSSESFPGDNLSYPYTKDKTGSDLEELLGAERISSIDSFFKFFYHTCTDKKTDTTNLRSLKIERTASKEINTGNGRENCSGFTVHGLTELKKDTELTVYLSHGYIAEMDVTPADQDTSAILFQEKGRKISLSDGGDLELSLTFSDSSYVHRPGGNTRDLAEMSEMDILNFVMRMVIRSSGISSF